MSFAYALGRSLVKSAGTGTNTLAGAAAGGLLGGVGSWLSDDEAGLGDHLLRAGVGAAGGAMLGRLYSALQPHLAPPQEPITVDKDQVDKAVEIWKRETAKGWDEGLGSGWTSLYDEAKHRYKAVGGMDEAIRRAEEAKKINRERGFNSGDKTLTPREGLLDSQAKRKIRVRGVDFPDGTGGMYNPYDVGLPGTWNWIMGNMAGADSIMMKDNSDSLVTRILGGGTGRGNKSLLQHELTHAAEMGGGVDARGLTSANKFLADPVGKAHIAYPYTLKPVEVDARLADLKRTMVEVTGRHVDTLDQARKAIKLLESVDDKRLPFDMKQLKDLLPRKNLPVDRPQFGDRDMVNPYDDGANKTLEHFLLQRMLELVKSPTTSASGVPA
jgi:hypothetical protein